MNDTIDISRQEGCFEFVRPEGFAGDVSEVGEREVVRFWSPVVVVGWI